MNFYVYSLIDPIDLKPFYVGKGTGNRVYTHVAQTKRWMNNPRPNERYNIAKLQKIKDILDRGQEPIIIRPYTDLDEETAFELEKQLIDTIGLDNLTNMLTGGGGCLDRNNPNYGNKWSEEQRKHQSNVHKEKYANGYTNPATGRKRKDLTERNKKGAKKVYKINLQNEVVHVFESFSQAKNIDGVQTARVKNKSLPTDDGFFYRYDPYVENIEELITKKEKPHHACIVHKCDLDGIPIESFESIEDAVKSIENLGGKYDALYWNMGKGKPYKGFRWSKN